MTVEEADREMRLREERSQQRQYNEELDETYVHVFHLLS
jgi:hypothetical protein